MQVATYTTGGFAVHKIAGDFEGHASGYFDSDGKLSDAEFIRGNNSFPVKRDGPAWDWIEKEGRRAKSLHDVAERVKADSLLAKIAGTNNGYIFAPDGHDMSTARAFPDLFIVKEVGGDFPFRILKK